MKELNVFFDTNVLLKAFLQYRNLHKNEITIEKLSDYLTDKESNKVTFEKCIFETYMAIRGIGGKKPDEGRGDWADRFLKELDDPYNVSKLISKYHSDSKGYAFLWLNRIDEFDFIDLEDDINFVEKGDRKEVVENIRQIRELQQQKQMFEKICWEFNDMLKYFNIKVLTYLEVFSNENKNLSDFTPPTMLDSFVRSTAIPSEDFEIVYCASRLKVRIFLTDDKKLIVCSKSLGFNNVLSAAAFCESKNYSQKKEEWKHNAMSAKLDDK